jgi:predicted AlkP superfamily pyrophosphatase or phosphodiesterase
LIRQGVALLQRPFLPGGNMIGSLRRVSSRILVVILGLALGGVSPNIFAQQISPVITVDHGPNAPQQISKHYVVLVSMDGFRYDYAKKYHAEHLLALAGQGASAPEGMRPAYPSITFPNHYTIVTGLYPEHHGIVANSFYDPDRKETYSYRDGKTVVDGTWYGGTPLWVVAEEQGMRSACFFWVGSEADIQGVRPTYYLKFDATFPNKKRVEQVLAWLQRPPEQRPHMITLYFSDADTAGHRYGPDSTQVEEAVHELDSEIGKLMDGIKESKLPVDLIVLADHGMATVEGAPIHLDQFGLKTSWFVHITGANMYPKSEEDAQRAYEALEGKSDKFDVYRRAKVPAYLHFDSNARAGDPVVVPTGPYLIDVSEDAAAAEHLPKGAHGYDATRMPEMKAIFVAEGPDIREGVKLEPFESVDVYPMIAKILGLDISNLKTGPIDGKLDALEGVLKTK